MIRQLYIENVAVIEKATIDFTTGFHVFTGETGAGKSIIIGAINAILGSRTSKDIVRSGTSKAFVSCLFSDISPQTKNLLAAQGIECENDELLISREISKEGKSICRIDGRPATLAVLKELGESMIDIYGQHDSRFLLSADRHIGFIDTYGELNTLVSTYKECYSQLQNIDVQIKKLSQNDADKARLIDLLSYQINEIDSCELISGEEEELLAQKKRFQNSEKLTEHLGMIVDRLEGNEYSSGVCQSINEIISSLETCTSFFPEFEEMAQSLQDISYTMDEFAADIRNKLDDSDNEELDINQIEARLDLIYRLKRKYGSNIDEILLFCEKSREELLSISTSEEQLKQLTAEYDQTMIRLMELGNKLSDNRKKAALDLEKKVTEELSFLNMPNVIFTVHCEKGAPSFNGLDHMVFYFSPNLGEEPKPIAKIASGGELSRLMLALKSVLSQNDDVSTMIFDEVDAGVSGLAAEKIGFKLRKVAQERQVLCVTHLAQIASMGHTHYLIEKHTSNGKTVTSVNQLDNAGRIDELARIMSGSTPSDAARTAAKEMLEKNLSV